MFSKPLFVLASSLATPLLLVCICIAAGLTTKQVIVNFWRCSLQTGHWASSADERRKRYFINLSLCIFNMAGTFFITQWYKICVHLVICYWKLFLKNKQTNKQRQHHKISQTKNPSPKSSTGAVVLHPVLIDQINPPECGFMQLPSLKSI